jgi:tRNA(fMet)-specific endonuclease VapC
VRYVLDTNVVSALMRHEAAAVSRLLALSPRDVVMPQPVAAEIRYGLARLPRSRRRAALADSFRRLLGSIRRADWTDEVSDRFGAVKAHLESRGERLDDFDVAIAAHALALDAVLVTANERHLGRVPGLALEVWSGA